MSLLRNIADSQTKLVMRFQTFQNIEDKFTYLHNDFHPLYITKCTFFNWHTLTDPSFKEVSTVLTAYSFTLSHESQLYRFFQEEYVRRSVQLDVVGDFFCWIFSTSHFLLTITQSPFSCLFRKTPDTSLVVKVMPH